MNNMDIVTIIAPPGPGVKTGAHTKVVTSSGYELDVCSIDLHIHLDEIIMAKMDIAVNFKEVTADAIFGLESLRRMAKYHDYELVKAREPIREGP